MLPKQFDYYAPKSLSEALDLLSKNDDAKLLAGGQSLIPMMKLRLATPATIIDISKIPDIYGISRNGDSVRIGSMERISKIASSREVSLLLPALHDAASSIADTQVRNMGTIGGNIANADPSNDMPVVVLAYGARLNVFSKSGSRIESSDSFFTGPYSTKVNPDEILGSVGFDIKKAKHGSAYSRIDRVVGDYALAACAAYLELDYKRSISTVRIAASGCSDRTIRLEESESTMLGKTLSKTLIKSASEKAYSSAKAEDSYYADSETKRRALSHVVESALTKAARRIR
ncbi:MAG: hypothetical protein BK997_02910 [Candidatus Micrarchaeum sp. ARMAN-1]|nr:MAG: hypothetical protein BK997_02910 [Candidatus Micrarchaeum sp. ARMAN-1]